MLMAQLPRRSAASESAPHCSTTAPGLNTSMILLMMGMKSCLNMALVTPPCTQGLTFEGAPSAPRLCSAKEATKLLTVDIIMTVECFTSVRLKHVAKVLPR